MTQQEKLTIEDLNRKFDAYIQADEEWKREIEAKMNPLVEDRLDRMIVQKYGVMAFKVAVAILGILISGFVLLKMIREAV